MSAGSKTRAERGVKDPRRARRALLGVSAGSKTRAERETNSAGLPEARTVYAVVTATPDHGSHNQQAERVKVGKDGDLEKPMSLFGENGARRTRRCAPRIG